MMEYPFPGPRASIVLECVVVLALAALAFLPLVSVVLRRGPPRRNNVVSGLLAAGVTVAVTATFPHVDRGLPHPDMGAVTVLGTMVFLTNFIWSFTSASIRDNTYRARLSELCAPYGVAFGFLVLASLPSLDTPREASRRTQCRNNLKQIGLAFHNYHDTFDQLPALSERPRQPDRSWRVDLLPYLDQAPLRKQYVDAAEWDSAQNLPLAKHNEPTFLCLSDPNQTHNGMMLTGYAGVRGPNTMFPDGRGITFREVTDGLTNTAMIVEACGRQIVWTEPRDINLAEQRVGVNLPGEKRGRSQGTLSSYHHGGGHVLLGDGSLRFVSEKIDPAVLKALLTASGGDTVPGNW